MARFYYKVWVDIPDDPGFTYRFDKEEREDWADDYNEDADGDPTVPVWSHEALSKIVMSERLGCDEDYGFDYVVDYEQLERG